jgi:alanine racemase
MDMCLVDMTDISGVALDDEVVLIGRQGAEEIAADEVADLCATISYEILCSIAARVPRVYLQGGRVVAVEMLGLGLMEKTEVGAS